MFWGAGKVSRDEEAAYQPTLERVMCLAVICFFSFFCLFSKPEPCLAVPKELEKSLCWNHIEGLWIWIKKSLIRKSRAIDSSQEGRWYFVDGLWLENIIVIHSLTLTKSIHLPRPEGPQILFLEVLLCIYQVRADCLLMSPSAMMDQITFYFKKSKFPFWTLGEWQAWPFCDCFPVHCPLDPAGSGNVFPFFSHSNLTSDVVTLRQSKFRVLCIIKWEYLSSMASEGLGPGFHPEPRRSH